MADPFATVTPERQRRIEQVRELRALGYLQREIAEQLGLPRSAVSDLLSDPDNKKKRARRLRYGGACRRCGGLTDGSQGTGPPPELCKDCAALEQYETRFWTRATIVAAMREFAARVGRPLTTADVMVRTGAPAIERKLSAARVAEIVAIPSDLRLPAPWVVQREFGSWDAALAAAGFEPNATGGAGHRNHGRRRAMSRRFVVLSKNGSGWVPRETVDAHDPEDAIQRVADSEGTYVAVPEPQWQERTVAPKTIFAVVEEA